MAIKDTIAGHATTANTFLTGKSRDFAAAALKKSRASTGILSKLAGFAGTAAKWFSGLGPWGKAAAIGTTLIVGKNALSGGGNQHPAQRYV